MPVFLLNFYCIVLYCGHSSASMRTALVSLLLKKPGLDVDDLHELQAHH